MKKIPRAYLQATLFAITLSLVALRDRTRVPQPEIIEIDPKLLTKKNQATSDPKWIIENKWLLLPRERGGNWDLETIPWEAYAAEIYESAQLRYEVDYDWEETSYYQKLCRGLETGDTGYAGRFNDQQDIHDHLATIDQLYAEIASGGYKRAADVFEKRHESAPRTVSYRLGRLRSRFDDVAVNFDRYGEPLFVGDGTHRVSLAKVADLDTIPVRVHLRHRQWDTHRTAIETYCRQHGNLTPIAHPDIPFDEYDIATHEIREPLEDAIVGEFLVEFTKYVFPAYATTYDHIPAFTLPRNDRIRRLNAVFGASGMYTFTQIDSVADLPHGCGTAIVTTGDGTITESERRALERLQPQRLIVVTDRSQTLDGVPQAYTQTTRSAKDTVAWHVCELQEQLCRDQPRS